MRGCLFIVAACSACAVLSAVVPRVAEAAPNQKACVASYEESQTQMRRSHLHEARASLQTCLDEACPSTLRADCAGWLKEVETRTPSVVVEVVQDGATVKDAKLAIDGKPQLIDGRAIEIDPGAHAFKVDAPTGTASADTMLREGEKLRVVRLELPATKKPEPPPTAAVVPAPAPSYKRPTPWTVWATGGVGVVSLGVFGAFAATGKSDEHGLEPCKPSCTQSQIDHVHGKYVAADVFLGIGVVALGAATVLYFTRPRITVEKSALFELVTGQPVAF